MKKQVDGIKGENNQLNLGKIESSAGNITIHFLLVYRMHGIIYFSREEIGWVVSFFLFLLLLFSSFSPRVIYW